jgi:membrane protein implicated in regulation of membrane protease activity
MLVNMKKQKSARWHTIYSIISTVLEELGIFAFLVWILPLFGVSIPVWGIVLILIVFAIYSYIMYRIGHPTISYIGVNSPEQIIGSIGIVENWLVSKGYVRVRGELWKSISCESNLKKGEEVMITEMDGLTLTIVRKICPAKEQD